MTRFCAHCGAALENQLPTQCNNCSSWTFVSVKPAASAIIIRDQQFLAVRRAQPPAVDRWDIPGGFCEGFEHPQETAIREVLEETGLHIDIGEFVGHYTDEYDYQGDLNPTLSMYYLARLIDPAAVPQDVSDETSGMQWFSLLDPPSLAFPHQDQAIHHAARIYDRCHTGT